MATKTLRRVAVAAATTVVVVIVVQVTAIENPDDNVDDKNSS